MSVGSGVWSGWGADGKAGGAGCGVGVSIGVSICDRTSKTGSSRATDSSSPTTEHSAPILSAAALRTRNTGSSASETISCTTNWQQSSRPIVGARFPRSWVATTRFSSTSLSWARQSTAVSTVGPMSSARSSAASSTSASDAASHTADVFSIPSSCAPEPLSSSLSKGTISEITVAYAVGAAAAAAASAARSAPSADGGAAVASGSASSTRANATICSASAWRTGGSGSAPSGLSSGTSSASAVGAPTCSAHAPSSRQ